ncbi:MAG: YggT family protein [Chloroflexi bacterium]|nr:YggT family protein [Chloroflexota bacterium]
MVALINLLLTLFTIAIFARVILSFIVPMMGASPHPVIISINTLVNQITEPVLGPIRRNLPSFGGFDFSPMAVLIIIILLREFVVSRL